METDAVSQRPNAELSMPKHYMLAEMKKKKHHYRTGEYRLHSYLALQEPDCILSKTQLQWNTEMKGLRKTSKKRICRVYAAWLLTKKALFMLLTDLKYEFYVVAVSIDDHLTITPNK